MKNCKFVWLIVTLLVLLQCYANTQTVFSTYPYSSRRYSTNAKDKSDGLLMPQYKDLASNLDTGITLADWQKHFLSEERFFKLDKDGNGRISRAELDEDDFMGECEQLSQDKELINQVCKQAFPDYVERLKILNQKGYRILNNTVDYYVNKNIYYKNDCPPIVIKSEYPGTNEVATMTYINLKNGQPIEQRLDLGSFVLKIMQNQHDDDSLTPLIFGVILLAVAVASAILVPPIK